MPRHARVHMLVLATAVAASLSFAATATASVRSCAFRNPAGGALPYVRQVTTNLTSSALGGGSVCAAVRAAVRRVQLIGYELGGTRRVVDANRSWVVAHDLVFPNGWPAPSGPVYDPHMRVVLHLVSPSPPGSAPALGTVPGRRHGHRYWIRLNEYT
jgi:hypothetical protein